MQHIRIEYIQPSIWAETTETVRRHVDLLLLTSSVDDTHRHTHSVPEIVAEFKVAIGHDIVLVHLFSPTLVVLLDIVVVSRRQFA